MQPKVSVVIPCYKVEKYLDRCVESVVKQTLKDLEIILVDDGSPDHVPEMCDEWALKDARIKVIHKKNAGLGMACNAGIEVATGKYIAFLDSDDWVDDDMYQTMYDTAEKYQAQMVFTGLKRVNDMGILESMNHPQKFKIYKGKKNIEELMMAMIASEPSDRIERHIQMSAKAVLYSLLVIQSNFIRFQCEREVISEDLIFNLDNLMKCQCACVLPHRFYNYYCNQLSLTFAIRLDRFEKDFSIREMILERYSSYVTSHYFLQRVNRMFIGYIRSDLRHFCKASNIKRKDKIKLLRQLSLNPIWGWLKNNYPINLMPAKHRLMFILLLYRKIHLLNFILNHV